MMRSQVSWNTSSTWADSCTPSSRRTKRNNDAFVARIQQVERGRVAACVGEHQLVVGHGVEIGLGRRGLHAGIFT